MDGAIVKKNAGFAGLQNYREVFADPVFWESVGNTLYFTVMSVIFHLLIGLAFALLLNSPRVNRCSGASCGCSSSCRGSSPR